MCGRHHSADDRAGMCCRSKTGRSRAERSASSGSAVSRQECGFKALRIVPWLSEPPLIGPAIPLRRTLLGSLRPAA